MRSKGLVSGIVSLGLLAGCSGELGERRDDFIDNFRDENPNFVFSESDRVSLYGFGGLGGNLTRELLTEVRDSFVRDGYYPHYKVNKALVYLNDLPSKLDWIKKDLDTGSEFIFLGHSLGCRNAVKTARALDEINVPVMLVFMDPVFFTEKIPDNVYEVINYRSNDFVLNGKDIDKRDLDSPNTRITNFRFDTGHNGFIEDKIKEAIAHDVCYSFLSFKGKRQKE